MKQTQTKGECEEHIALNITSLTKHAEKSNIEKLLWSCGKD